MPWILIILVLVVAAIVLIVKFLPWWASLILFAIPILAWKYVAAFIITMMIRRTALDMAKALAGADYELHSLQALPPPDKAVLDQYMAGDEDEQDEDDKEFDESLKEAPDEPPEARDWYEVEATIQPKLQPNEEGDEQPVDWSPDSLMLVKPGLEWGEIDEACLIARIETEHEGRFKTGLHAYGPTRVRLLIGVTPGTDRLVFRYMFAQEFGPELKLPLPAEKPAKPT